MHNENLLTVAIPTYNRSSYLDCCLAHLAEQPEVYGQEVTLMVSDNCSTDTTGDVVKKWQSRGVKVDYLRNRSNVGPDDNSLQCLRKASGKYVLILGDDDVLLPGALGFLLPVLRSGEYGVVHLNAYPFINDCIAECPKSSEDSVMIFKDSKKFIRKMGIFSTCISMNVINRNIVPDDLDLEDFRDTNLIQLAWVFGAAIAAKKNAFISRFCVAILIYNSGGYQFTRVFVRNVNKVFDIFTKRGVPGKLFEPLKRKMLISFYPANIIRGRKRLTGLQQDRFFKAFYPMYRGYLAFWIFTLPAIILPLNLAFGILNIVDRLRKKLPALFMYLRG